MRTPYQKYVHGPTDASFLLVAVMLERLRLDVKLNGRVKCGDIGDPNTHAVRDCAMVIMRDWNMYRADNPDADHVDLALELIRLHQ